MGKILTTKKISAGKGRTRVHLEIRDMGNKIHLRLYGGEEHVGCMATCKPGEKPESTKFGKHKEHVVAEPLVKAACEKYGRLALCIAGIHIANATPEEIKQIINNCKELEKKLNGLEGL